MMACLMLEWTGRMFLWISSMGPGRWEILSFKSSASRALFSCSCLAWSDGSADVSGSRQKKPNNGHFCEDTLKLFVTLQTDGKLYVALTLEDMHSDQFGSLRPTPDLPLEIVLSLERESDMFIISPSVILSQTFHLQRTSQVHSFSLVQISPSVPHDIPFSVVVNDISQVIHYF